MGSPQIVFHAGGILVVSIETAGGTQRDRARMQVRRAIAECLADVLRLPASAIRVQSTPGVAPRMLIGGDSGAGAPSAARTVAASFSHESGLSLAAVNLEGAVGVDLMRMADIPDWQAVARDYLGPDASAALLALPAPDRPRAFAQAWTANEARLKCQGRQLVEWSEPGASPQPHGRIQTLTLALPDGFAGSLATSA